MEHPFLSLARFSVLRSRGLCQGWRGARKFLVSLCNDCTFFFPRRKLECPGSALGCTVNKINTDVKKCVLCTGNCFSGTRPNEQGPKQPEFAVSDTLKQNMSCDLSPFHWKNQFLKKREKVKHVFNYCKWRKTHIFLGLVYRAKEREFNVCSIRGSNVIFQREIWK